MANYTSIFSASFPERIGNDWETIYEKYLDQSWSSKEYLFNLSPLELQILIELILLSEGKEL